MIRPIMTQRFFLQQPSDTADARDAADSAVAQDLADTLDAKRASCVGLAANMIGKRKRIIAVLDGDGSVLVMFNPRLVRQEKPYATEEGCLSLPGTRPTTRYERIVVAYEDAQARSQQRRFQGFVAQAIQHEIDHCNGVLI
jgi:peptide deformylase